MSAALELVPDPQDLDEPREVAPQPLPPPRVLAPYFDDDRAALFRGEALGILCDLPGGCVDAVITDPPYSSGGAFRGDRMLNTTAKYVNTDVQKTHPDFSGDNRDQRSFAVWCALWLSECLRIAKPAAPICVFTDWRQLPSVTDAIQAGGWIWRGIGVWDKTEGVRPFLGRFRQQAEFLVWGTNGPAPLRPEVGALPGVWRHSSKGARKEHIAAKDVDLMRQVVRICDPGGVVLDPFNGSGSTGVAALLEGRRYLGIELHEHNLQVSVRRLCEVG